MNYRDDPDAALLPDPELYMPAVECYKAKSSNCFLVWLVGLACGIALCLAGIMVIN